MSSIALTGGVRSQESGVPPLYVDDVATMVQLRQGDRITGGQETKRLRIYVIPNKLRNLPPSP
ncbi:hypothetical protein HC891_11735 [Candidatus Gracilibacteria bacterium]|nr:hypothetical protein [Candidatus Gracilibacteria bacterium]